MTRRPACHVMRDTLLSGVYRPIQPLGQLRAALEGKSSFTDRSHTRSRSDGRVELGRDPSQRPGGGVHNHVRSGRGENRREVRGDHNPRWVAREAGQLTRVTTDLLRVEVDRAHGLQTRLLGGQAHQGCADRPEADVDGSSGFVQSLFVPDCCSVPSHWSGPEGRSFVALSPTTTALSVKP